MPYVDNRGIRIYYEIEGHGSPLVMLHGFSMTSTDWHEFGYVAGMREDYRLILIDARGYGTSDKPSYPDAYHWKFLAEDVVAVMDDLQLDQTHFWGWSWGGAIAYVSPINTS